MTLRPRASTARAFTSTSERGFGPSERTRLAICGIRAV